MEYLLALLSMEIEIAKLCVSEDLSQTLQTLLCLTLSSRFKASISHKK